MERFIRRIPVGFQVPVDYRCRHIFWAGDYSMEVRVEGEPWMTVDLGENPPPAIVSAQLDWLQEVVEWIRWDCES